MSHLRNLFIATTTDDTRDSGTDDKIVLTVTQNGVDRLNHTFSTTSQSDLERGEANLYEVDVRNRGIDTDPNDLNNTDFRLGISDDDLWRPEHAVVWGERNAGRAIVPLAIERDIPSGLSQDRKDNNNRARPSMLLRGVNSGNENMIINSVLVMMTTGTGRDHETNSKVELQIGRPGSLLVAFEFPDSSQSDQERGEANLYFAQVTAPFRRRDLNADSILLRIKGKDAWQPRSFFLFGLDDRVGRPESMVPLVHLRRWNLGQMSADTSEGRREVDLPLAPLP